MLRKNLLGGLALFAVLLFSAQVFAQADKRQALMKENSAANKAIKGAVERTIVAGRTAFDGKRLTTTKGSGRFIARTHSLRAGSCP